MTAWGGVEQGETWQTTAVRECQEETGWRVRIDGLLGIYGDPATQVRCYPDGRWRHSVTLEVACDGPAVVHVHGFDHYIRLDKAGSGKVTCTADLPGVFEIETHDTGLLFYRLVVRLDVVGPVSELSPARSGRRRRPL